jgi:hypothetical protein
MFPDFCADEARKTHQTVDRKASAMRTLFVVLMLVEGASSVFGQTAQKKVSIVLDNTLVHSPFDVDRV